MSLRLLVPLFVFTVRLLPRRRRYAPILFATNVSAFVLELFFALSRRPRPPLRSLHEHCLATLIGARDVRQIAFDPRIDTVGLELIAGEAAQRNGVFVATTHLNAGLCRAILRVLHDRNVMYDVLSSADAFPVCGAATSIRPIPSEGGKFLLTIRKRLREKGVVLAMLDSDQQMTRASVVVETREGSFWISEPILHVARRIGADIVLMRAHLRNGKIVIEFERGGASYGPTELARQLGAFALQPLQLRPLRVTRKREPRTAAA